MRALSTLAIALLSSTLLLGCPGTIQVTGGTDLGAIVDALRVITTNDGEPSGETITVSSRGGTCARQQGVADDLRAAYEEYEDVTLDSADDVDAAREYCEEMVQYYEQVAAIYSRTYEVNSWVGGFSLWGEGGYAVEPGQYESDGSGDGQFSGQIMKIEGNPYADYRTIDFDCQEWADEYVNGDGWETIPAGPTTDELYESLDQWWVTEGSATVEERGSSLHISIEDGELADSNGRSDGSFTLTARLTDCEYEPYYTYLAR